MACHLGRHDITEERNHDGARPATTIKTIEHYDEQMVLESCPVQVVCVVLYDIRHQACRHGPWDAGYITDEGWESYKAFVYPTICYPHDNAEMVDRCMTKQALFMAFCNITFPAG